LVFVIFFKLLIMNFDLGNTIDNPVVFFRKSSKHREILDNENDSKNISLYVGNLQESVTEISLFYLFSRLGQIESVKLCRDTVTGKHLGFGYIDFKDSDEIIDIVKNIEFDSELKKNFKGIKIIRKETDDSLRESGYCNIFVKNLPPNFTGEDFFKIFTPFGHILSSKIALDENEKSLEFGFVNFENQSSADNAIEKINGKMVGGKKIFVGPFIKKEKFNLLMQKKNLSKKEQKFTNIYIKNLDLGNYTEKYLEDLFGVFGEITSIYIPKDNNNKPKGFAFVNYSSSIEAEDAVFKMHQKKIGDVIVYVARAMKKEERKRAIEQVDKSVIFPENLGFMKKTFLLEEIEVDSENKKFISKFTKSSRIVNFKIIYENRSSSKKLYLFTIKNRKKIFKMFRRSEKKSLFKKFNINHFNEPILNTIKKIFQKHSEAKARDKVKYGTFKKKKEYCKNLISYFSKADDLMTRKGKILVFFNCLLKKFNKKLASSLSKKLSSLDFEKNIQNLFCKKKLLDQFLGCYSYSKKK